jgi:MoxR-like ATPase
MFNVLIDYLPPEQELEVVLKTTSEAKETIEPIFTAEDVLQFHKIVRRVPIAEEVARFAVSLAGATRPNQETGLDFINDWVSWGAGMRAAQALVLAGKARALLQGRAHVTNEDIAALAKPTLRHRVLLSYRAEAEGLTIEDVIDRLMESVKPGA